MVAGSVTVASDETRTGSGMALYLYDADVLTMPAMPTVPTLGSTAAPWNATYPVSASDVAAIRDGRLATLREKARIATAYGYAIVHYIQDTATVSGPSIT